MAESQKNAVIEGERENREVRDDISSIFGIIKEMCDYRDKEKERLKV